MRHEIFTHNLFFELPLGREQGIVSNIYKLGT
jgi:hypothetical protein